MNIFFATFGWGQGGGRMEILDRGSDFFFNSSARPPLPLLPNIVGFNHVHMFFQE